MVFKIEKLTWRQSSDSSTYRWSILLYGEVMDTFSGPDYMVIMGFDIKASIKFEDGLSSTAKRNRIKSAASDHLGAHRTATLAEKDEATWYMDDDNGRRYVTSKLNKGNADTVVIFDRSYASGISRSAFATAVRSVTAKGLLAAINALDDL